MRGGVNRVTPSDHAVRLAADIGGTFTDVVLEQGAERYSTKVLTTSARPEEGVGAGIDQVLDAAGLAPGDIDIVLHGTTLATNALIERRGARTAFITTKGFRDILETGYEKRFDHYDLMIEPPPPIVPRVLRFGIPERIDADGQVVEPLDEAALRQVADTLAEHEIEAVAVGFLHAYRFGDHERQARQILADCLGDAVTICLSSDVCPEIREYERFSTTCANAYVRPLMAGYLTRMGARLRQRGIAAPLYLMMSGGGLTTLENAARYPIRLVESGPAGGAILAAHIARQSSLDQVLSFDMGGTTAKICLIDNGEPERSRLFEVARTYRDMKGSGWPVRVPVIEMVEIGAGGGSVARVDPMGRITVGPDSAGSDPGPVSYGRGGTAPTVTDANLGLGKIDADYFAGGKIALKSDDAAAALADHIGAPLGLADHWPAAGVTEIVEENMANAARVHAIERGKAIGAHTMIAFGGGAPLHAGRLAEKLGIDRVVVPAGAGVGSAIGFLRAPVAYEVARSLALPLSPFDTQAANALLDAMADEAGSVIAPALNGTPPQCLRIADIRYVGQGHEIRVVLPDGTLTTDDGARLRSDFEALYEQIYGLILPDMEVEAVTWSVTLSIGAAPDSDGSSAIQSIDPPAAKSERKVYDPTLGDRVSMPVFWRFDLEPGMHITGPAVIAEDETSTIVPASFDARIDGRDAIVMERRP